MSTQEKKNEINQIKYNLYLDRDKKNFIQFNLDNNNITIEDLLIKYKDSLADKMNTIYKKNIDECAFLIIENKINKKNEEIPSLMEFKINKRIKLYNLLQNPQNNLYFLPKRKSNKEECLKARNEKINRENNFDLVEIDYFINKNPEEYLPKSLIYLYDTSQQTFIKEEGSVDKQKIIIYKSKTNKELIEICIKDIVKDLFYSETSQEPYKKNLPTKGNKPKYFIEIVTNKITYFFGQFKENLFIQWEKAIKKALTKYNNFNVELNLNIKINSSKTGIYAIEHSIMDNCFILNKILFNKEKRKMFFSISPEKKICSIIINILSYKELIKKDEYLEAWMSFKEILAYIESCDSTNSNQKEEKILKIFSQEKINNYKKISEDSNENLKKINGTNSSLSLFQIEVKKALNEILKFDLFDDIFIELYKIYIIPFFQEIKNILKKESHPLEKPLIRQKFQFLLAINFNKIFDNTTDNFADLYSNINNKFDISRTETLSNVII